MESNTCGLFQLYFYKNSFMLLLNSQIKEEKQLNKKTTATLLNDKKWIKKENERRIGKYNSEPRSTILFSRNKGLQHRCFLVAKFSRTYIFKNICLRLPWTDFRKWLFGTLFLDSHFQNHLHKNTSRILGHK